MNDLGAWLAQFGFTQTPILDGQIHRFDRNSRKSGWFWGVEIKTSAGEPFIIASIGDWNGNEKHEFKSQRIYTPTEKNEIKEARKRLEAEHKKQKLEMQLKSQVEATELWKSLPAEGESEYLDRKKITRLKTLGVRFKEGVVYVPVWDITGTLWSLQKLYPDKKRFLSGGKVIDCFHVIGFDLLKEAKLTYIAEGFATAASIHMATECPVVVAFSASALPRTAEIFKKAYPDLELIVAGDNDEAGQQFASKCGLSVIYPTIDGDFNDLHVSQGLDAVATQLENVRPPEPLDWKSVQKSDIEDILPDWNYKETKDGELRKTSPKSTIENLEKYLDLIGVKARYNVITKKEEVLVPSGEFSADNESSASLGWVISALERINYGSKYLRGYLTALCDQHRYNPVADWILSKPWDGISRLESFYSTVTAKDEHLPAQMHLKKTLIKRWMISAVAAAFEPKGVKAHGVLVFQGVQYIGKTSWVLSLAPKNFNFIKEGAILRPDVKDSVLQIIQYWIAELGELDSTFRKADIAQLKAFITKQNDVERRHYAAGDSHFHRRTVFFGSVNDDKFLVDDTGNRRFWTIAVEKLNDKHGLDMQQIWAEYHDLYMKKEPWLLNFEEMALLNKSNSSFEMVDPVEEVIYGKFDWSSAESNWTYLTSADVLEKIKFPKLDRSTINKVGPSVKRIVKRLVEERLIAPLFLPLAKKNNDRFWHLPPLLMNTSMHVDQDKKSFNAHFPVNTSRQ